MNEKLSEGAPSEEPLGDTVFQFGDDAQAYRAWQAIVDAIPQEVQSDWEAIDYLRTLIRWTLGSPAGVAPQAPVNLVATSPERAKSGWDSLHVLDPEKVAEALCRGIHSTRFQYRATRFACEDCSKGSRALCVAYTEGKLTK